MAMDSIGAAGISAAQGAVDLGVGYSLSKKAATKAWKRSKKAYKHRYQWAVEDMRAAGINPILAAMSPGSAPQAQMQNVPKMDTDIIGALSSASQIATAKSQRGVLRETALKTKAERELIEAQKPRAEAEAELWRRIGPVGAAARELLPWIGGGAIVGGTAKMLGRARKTKVTRGGMKVSPQNAKEFERWQRGQGPVRRMQDAEERSIRGWE